MQMISDFKIRSCKDSDFENVFTLLPQLWPGKDISRSLTKAVFNDALQSGNQFYFCVEKNDHLVAFASSSIKFSLWKESVIAHIDEIVVDEDYRGNGIGTAMICHLEDFGRKQGCKLIELDSAYSREYAHKFYEFNGYTNRAALFSKVLLY